MSISADESGLRLRRAVTVKQLVRFGCFAACVAAAAYLWAVVFGHGLHGLKSSVALDKQPDSADFPNANVAFIAAVVAFVASPMLAWWWTDKPLRHTRWYLLAAALGIVVFATVLLAS